MCDGVAAARFLAIGTEPLRCFVIGNEFKPLALAIEQTRSTAVAELPKPGEVRRCDEGVGITRSKRSKLPCDRMGPVGLLRARMPSVKIVNRPDEGDVRPGTCGRWCRRGVGMFTAQGREL